MSASAIRPSRQNRNTVAKAPAVRVSPALALAIAAGAILLPAGAQETTSTTATNRIPEVVVTATRSATAPENTAASVTIIDRDEIEARKISTLADALQGIPSMSVVRNGTPGQATSVFTRGTESNHTLLMIDGRRIPANLAGGYDYANLSLDNIDRIEVVRTGSSSLYGGDAIGGVINLITRTGRGMEKPETEFSFEGGSFNTFREGAASRGASGKFDYSVSASQLNANFPRNNNQYRNSSIRSSFGYELNEAVYFDLKASYYQSDGGSPGSTTFPSTSDHLKREVANISPGVIWTPSDRFESKFYYTYDHQFQPSLDFGTINRLTVLANQIDWQNTIKALDNWTITAGMGFQDIGIKRTSGGVTGIDQSQTGVGAYIQSQFEPVEGLHLINSVRYDSYSDYGSAGTWRQGLSYRIPTLETLVHGSVSKSFAPPSAQDLYFPGGANPNLKPETSRGWEAGLEQPLWQEKIKLSATYFHNQIDNFIELDPTFTPQNIPRATTEGVETGLSFAPCKEFETRVSYTYLTATDDVNQRRLTRRPRHQLNWDITTRPIKKLTVTAGIGWTVEREDVGFLAVPPFSRINVPIEDFLTLRAAATYEINHQWQVWVRGENLTDNKYVYVAGFPALRAAVYGGLKFKF